MVSGRYRIIITTPNSFDYALGFKKTTEPNQSSDDRNSSADPVIPIKDMKGWTMHWDSVAPYNKLLVYEFYEKNSSLCEAMKKPFEKLARQYKGKADFCTLDVDNFEFFARLCGVEGAYPTFVLFKNGKQVGKVVGLKEDELKRSVERAVKEINT
ncbi:hypothetical protein ACP70R_024280 [Stipagrostis hirtigluma subsp. patula]